VTQELLQLRPQQAARVRCARHERETRRQQSPRSFWATSRVICCTLPFSSFTSTASGSRTACCAVVGLKYAIVLSIVH
jgi:hypothetical protein